MMDSLNNKKTESHQPNTMTAATTTGKIILAALRTAQAPARELVFAEHYIRQMDKPEIAEFTPEHLTAHIRALYQFVLSRPEGQVKVAVSNPEYTEHSAVYALLPDQPFLIDTVWLHIRRRGWQVHHSLHPALPVQRTADKLRAIAEVALDARATSAETWQTEALLHIEFDRQRDAPKLAELEQDLTHALSAAQDAVADFRFMTGRMEQVILRTERAKPSAHLAEELAFMRWTLQNNFVFLGYRRYTVQHPTNGEASVRATPKTGLGILRDQPSSLSKRTPFSQLTPNLRAYLNSDTHITVTKTLGRSTIHRDAVMDYIGVREFDEQQQVVAEHRFIGMFTSQAFTTPARQIPIVGHKIHAVLQQSALRPNSHNERALKNILETFPRDELFQINPPDLLRISLGILHLQERQQVRVFLRRADIEQRGTVFVFLPLDKMHSSQRHKIQAILRDAFHVGDLEYHVTMGDGPHAQLVFKFNTTADALPDVTEAELQRRIVAATLGWSDSFRQQLLHTFGTADGLELFQTYDPHLNASYTESTPPARAVADIQLLHNTNWVDVPIQFCFEISPQHTVHLRIFHRAGPISLGDILPKLQNLGLPVLTEHAFTLPYAGAPIFLHDYHIQTHPKQLTPLVQAEILHALPQIWAGEIPNDPLNQLLLQGLTCAQLRVLRAYIALLQQMVPNYAIAETTTALCQHPTLAQNLALLFEARFQLRLSQQHRISQETKHNQALESDLGRVASLETDTLLRRLWQLIRATVRTNAYQNRTLPDGQPVPLALKLDSTQLAFLPKPSPWREIFVHGTTVQGVHLRGGPLARGGIRWSSRYLDVRTEVLGLMKAQMTKNTLIIPVGAKGGFLTCQTSPNTHDTATQAYTAYMHALLSITDNRQGERILHPQGVVCHDEADPYLVVAADKGTAEFSDLANSIAQSAQYWEQDQPGFWLGDAFASGGSHGYDHKRMGITAKGAWEAVKHHFAQLGQDSQQQPFTVIGIGDMSGDVFGNGMLLSPHIKLVAAFDHRHIFLDPTPDPASSFQERQRLFHAGRSSWGDYNTKQLSRGGRIFARTAKDVQLTSQIKHLLGLSVDTLPPHELIKAILCAEVDLFWNGGIGTFVKASSQSHADAEDRTNDTIRVNADQLRCKIVAEGGNLGFTQLARIEFALHGGIINTDAVDNVGGVSTSDREVNLKILLNSLKLPEKTRNRMLQQMEPLVEQAVLYDTASQIRALTLATQHSNQTLETTRHLQLSLTTRGILQPTVEALPSGQQLEQRRQAGHSYTRPELAILLAYTKMALIEDLQATTLAEQKALQPLLKGYFPATLHGYPAAIQQHPLKAHILYTQLVNQLVAHMGITFVNRMQRESGWDAVSVVKAYLAARALFQTNHWWQVIETSALGLPTQLAAQQRLQQLTEFGTFWLLRHVPQPLVLDDTLHVYEPLFRDLTTHLPGLLSPHKQARLTQRAAYWVQQGLPTEMAQVFAELSLHVALPDLAKLTLDYPKQPRDNLIALYFATGERLHIAKLHRVAKTLPTVDNWQRVANLAVIDELYLHQRRLTRRVLDSQHTLHDWEQRYSGLMRQYDQHVQDVLDQAQPNLAMLNVIIGQLKGLSG